MKIDPTCDPVQNSTKMNQRLLYKPEAMNVIERKVGNSLELNSTEKIFLNKALLPQE